MCQYTIHKIPFTNSSSPFIQFLSFPDWFKCGFRPLFDQHRKTTQGMIFLLKTQDDETCGCIYIEITPEHVSYGDHLPIFGWLQVSTYDACEFLFNYVFSYLKAKNCSCLRGPINEPALCGGWGIKVKGEMDSPLIYSSRLNSSLKPYLLQLGFQVDTEYYSTEVLDYGPIEEPHFVPELRAYPLDQLIHNKEMIHKIRCLLSNTLFSRLPDSSNHQKIQRVLDLCASFPNNSDFYILAFEPRSNNLIAISGQIPNIFDRWQGKEIDTCIHDFAAIDRKYRGQRIFAWINYQLFLKLKKRGMKKQIAALVWTNNEESSKAILSGTRIVAKYQVFQIEFKAGT